MKPVITHYSLLRDQRFEADGKLLLQLDGDLDQILRTAYKKLGGGYRKFYKMDRLSQLGYLVAEALFQSRGGGEGLDLSRMGVVLSNAASSLDTDRHHQRRITDPGQYDPSPAVFVYTLPNIVIGEICIRHRISGENCFFIFERFYPEPIVNYMLSLFQTGQTKSCLGGWIEVDEGDFEAFMFLAETETKIPSLPLAADTLRALYRNPTEEWTP